MYTRYKIGHAYKIQYWINRVNGRMSCTRAHPRTHTHIEQYIFMFAGCKQTSGRASSARSSHVLFGVWPPRVCVRLRCCVTRVKMIVFYERLTGGFYDDQKR